MSWQTNMNMPSLSNKSRQSGGEKKEKAMAMPSVAAAGSVHAYNLCSQILDGRRTCQIGQGLFLVLSLHFHLL